MGIVAATHEGAALMVRIVSMKAQELYGEHQQPEMTLHCLPRYRFLECTEETRLKSWAALLLESVEHVRRSGAEFVVCPSVTAHLAYPLVAARTDLPWIHIVEALADCARTNGYRRVAVFGTALTMGSDSLLEPFGAHNIEYVVPQPEARQRMHLIIRNELVHGRARPESRAFLREQLSLMKALMNCDAVVLACTELPLVITASDSPLPIIDSVEVLAIAACREVSRA